MTTANDQYFRDYFTRLKPMYVELVESLSSDSDGTFEEAARIFDSMVPDMPYADDPNHPMAASAHGCSVVLAFFLALKREGVDEHAFGSAFLAEMRERMAAMPKRPPQPEEEARAQLEALITAGAASQASARPGEFVFETIPGGENDDHDWRMNILSCGICHAFGSHDAMALVPYMCATDDVMSDWGEQGLSRTGTIAVGAHHCDFEYQQGRAPDHLAERYPDRIQLKSV